MDKLSRLFAQHSVFYRYQVEIMGHLAIGGLILLGFSYFWKSRKQWPLDLSTFLLALSVYTLSMLSTPLGWHDASNDDLVDLSSGNLSLYITCL